MLSFFVLIVGFVFLIKGADLFVEGASLIAKKFKISPILIGLTIVAMGTSLPETAVSVASSIAGANDMSVANVVGSNLFNTLVVLGVSSMIKDLPVNKITKERDVPILLGMSVMLFICAMEGMMLGRFEGFLLLAGFIFFMIIIVSNSKYEIQNEEITEEVNVPMFKNVLIGLVGMIGIALGGELVVNSASAIAITLGMSQGLVGLTIVAVGTSLPEFVTSLVAIKKGETDIAIGNVIGSNIFNVLMVLGLASVISPIAISIETLIDIGFMIGAMVLLRMFIKNNNIGREHGIIMTSLYVIYIIYTIIR